MKRKRKQAQTMSEQQEFRCPKCRFEWEGFDSKCPNCGTDWAASTVVKPFKPTVGLTQVGVLHGELPNVLGDYDQQTMVDVLTWASENVVSCHGPSRLYTEWFIWSGRGSDSPCKPFKETTLYAALLAAWKARGEK